MESIAERWRKRLSLVFVSRNEPTYAQVEFLTESN